MYKLEVLQENEWQRVQIDYDASMLMYVANALCNLGFDCRVKECRSNLTKED